MEGKTIWTHTFLFQCSQASALGAKNSNTISSPFSLLYITNAKRKRKKNESKVFSSSLFVKTSKKIQFKKTTITKKILFYSQMPISISVNKLKSLLRAEQDLAKAGQTSGSRSGKPVHVNTCLDFWFFSPCSFLFYGWHKCCEFWQLWCLLSCQGKGTQSLHAAVPALSQTGKKQKLCWFLISVQYETLNRVKRIIDKILLKLKLVLAIPLFVGSCF